MLAVRDRVRRIGDRARVGRVVDPDPSRRGPWYLGRVEVAWGATGWRNFPLAFELVRLAEPDPEEEAERRGRALSAAVARLRAPKPAPTYYEPTPLTLARRAERAARRRLDAAEAAWYAEGDAVLRADARTAVEDCRAALAAAAP